ncbi:MAG: DUF5686 family protein [Flavipsychrobacter sp.]
MKLKLVLSNLFLLIALNLQAQDIIRGKVTDAASKEPLPFATIKIGNSGQGTVCDLNGNFEVQLPPKVGFIEIRYLGYESRRIELPYHGREINIGLKPEQGSLKEVVVTPPYDKMRRLINLTIANRDRNDPDKYDWYRCKIYYKMVCDAIFPDSALNDTSKDSRELKQFLSGQHLLMSETYSIRTWQKPQQLQEEVIGSRLSGFKKSMFTSLVTNTLPFHSYNDYMTLNGKDYKNPISKGWGLHYDFNLNDELLQGKDTVWVMSFRPKGSFDGLRGTVYINSDGYAITQLVAIGENKQLKHSVRIEQQYKKTEGRWFPSELNYIIDWQIKADKKLSYTLHMKGNSQIDSVNWNKDKDFRFDKVHTVKLMPNADDLNDVSWYALRPVELDEKENRTYQFMDSLGDKYHFDEITNYMRKLPEAKLPIGMVDVDLKRLYSYNKYEKSRIGLGLQTNEKLTKWLSVGGWGGYGFGDVHWKYGAFAEVYADKYKEFVIRAAYDNDLRDPGRINLNRDLDKNYLKSYLMSRVDNIESFKVSVRKRFGYWNAELIGNQEHIIPKYDYAMVYEGKSYNQFDAQEVTLNLRYAFAERRAPIFGYYNSLGSKYPIWYGRVTMGNLSSGNMQTSYTQAITAVLWNKHVNRLGYEHILVEGGKSWSDNPLPISKLFAGNGYSYDATSSLYGFGGLLTMTPYAYYTDQFVTLALRHDFDWKLYKLEKPDGQVSSAPNISLGYNMLYGTLNHPEVHTKVDFAVPDNAYHEAGLMLNNLVRLKYMDLYYITLNVGYFYHITPSFDWKNGRIVYGIGVEL